MTYEEAIKTIEVAKAEVEWNYPMDYQIAFDKAIEALERQTQKKPREDGIDRYCPVCGNYVGYVDAMATDTTNYCYECGQAVKWGDEQ